MVQLHSGPSFTVGVTFRKFPTLVKICEVVTLIFHNSNTCYGLIIPPLTLYKPFTTVTIFAFSHSNTLKNLQNYNTKLFRDYTWWDVSVHNSRLISAVHGAGVNYWMTAIRLDRRTETHPTRCKSASPSEIQYFIKRNKTSQRDRSERMDDIFFPLILHHL